jgi:multiple sugar transport system permease protein
MTPSRADAAHQEWLRGSAFLSPAVIALLLVVAGPIVFNLVISFTSASFLGSLSSLEFVGLANYIDVLSSSQFQRAFFVTIRFTVFTVALQILLGLAAGLLLAEEFRGRAFLRVLMVVPWAIPTVVSAITWRLIYAPDFGALNALLLQIGLISEYQSWLGNPSLALYAIGIADVWKNFPIVGLIVLAALQSAPQELYDAAQMDGAGPLRRFRTVTLPHITGPLMVALVLRTIDSVKVFDIIWVMTRGGPFSSTKSLSMLVYERTFSQLEAGSGSAIAFVITAICLVFILLYTRLLPGQASRPSAP